MVSVPAFVAAGALAASASAVSASVPAGIQNGDILLLVVETANEVVTTPTGWTAVNTPTGVGAASNGTRCSVFWKRTDGTDTSVSIEDSGNHQIGAVLAFRGCAPFGSPIGPNQGTGSNASSGTAVSVAAFNTTVANSMVVACVANGGNAVGTSGQAWSGVSSLTERLDAGSGVGNSGSISVTTGVVASTGSTGTFTATLASADIYEGVSFELLGDASIVGTLGRTLAALTTSSSGKLAIVGTSSRTLAPLTTAGTGALSISGNTNKTLDPLTTAAMGQETFFGGLSATLQPLTSNGLAVLLIRGLGGGLLAPLTAIIRALRPLVTPGVRIVFLEHDGSNVARLDHDGSNIVYL